MSGRHRTFKPGEWYCADCDRSHVGDCPCCVAPVDDEPRWLRFVWSVVELLQRKPS